MKVWVWLGIVLKCSRLLYLQLLSGLAGFLSSAEMTLKHLLTNYFTAPTTQTKEWTHWIKWKLLIVALYNISWLCYDQKLSFWPFLDICLLDVTQPTPEIFADLKKFESVKLKIMGIFYLCHSMPISDCGYKKNTVCKYFNNIYVYFKITFTTK